MIKNDVQASEVCAEKVGWADNSNNQEKQLAK